ncbi:MAG: hypothetical protein V1822_00050 [Candidatus Micrarchaeota archaeon]
MGLQKGQISIEFMAVLASMLLILILLIAIFSGIYSQQSLYTQQLQASLALSNLATAAKMAWIQGDGAYSYQAIDIPPSVQLESSSIGNYSMNLYVAKVGDSFEFTDFNVSGWWPNTTGTAIMAVRNNGSLILIRPAAMISVSPSGFYITDPGNYYLTITNSANESFDITQAFFDSCPSNKCTYNEEGEQNFDPGDSLQGRIHVSSFGSSHGIFPAYLQITAVPSESSSEFEALTLNIPITVVQ